MTATSAVKSDERVLLPQHEALIVASAVAPEVARARGYRSVLKRAELRGLGFGERQCRVPALLVPVWNVAGEIATYQIRPDEPRIVSGKALKYETPRGSRMVLDVPPQARQWLGDPQRPLFITEGARKSDSGVSQRLCCVALLGVWNWRGSNEQGGKVALADWDSIALNRRDVYICFDSDVMTKPPVHQAMARLRAFLEQRDARVQLIYLPPAKGGGKVGLDDYLAAGHNVADLLRLASPELRTATVAEDEDETALPYRATECGLVWLKPTANGTVTVPLANFAARIVGDIVEDDGAETRRLFEIEASLNGRTARLTIPTAQFNAMNWPVEHLGPGAVVYAGFGLRDHARAAVQILSGEPTRQRVYTHLGWREIDGAWVYLHGGRAIGAAGPTGDVEVRLPEALSRFELPDPPTGDGIGNAIRASLGTLDLALDTVTVPLLCAAWRAALGTADLSLHITGPTGTGKTELAALEQQHWGPGLDARHLPGSWSSTGNALEGLAFSAKDALLVVDDFAPAGTTADVARTHREADRLFRAQGNLSGRQRMRADASIRPPKPPRGLIISTGEDVPRGQSLRARLLVLELAPDALDWDHLSVCQENASNGLYAEALAGFLKWLAPRYGNVLAGLAAEVRDLRQQASQSALHRRVPDIVANLAVGLRYFLAYAQEAGALTADEADSLWERGWKALGEVAAAQTAHHMAAEPARRFMQLLRGAIASGRAHVASGDGGEPDKPGVWGWWRADGSTGYAPEWRAQGQLVGWLDGQDLYLEPDPSYAAAQSLAREMGDSLGVSPRTLHKRLEERGLLASTEPGRNTRTVRRTLAGARRTVLHVHAGSIMPQETDQTDQSFQSEAFEAAGGQFSGQFAVPSRDRTAQGNCPVQGGEARVEPVVGDLGNSVSSREDNTHNAHDSPEANTTAVDSTPAPQRPCYTCGGTQFWRAVDGAVVCATCHPPGSEGLVARWFNVNADGNDTMQAEVK